MRLTYELGHKGSGEYDTDNTKDMPANNIWKAINKLGQLEDIEDELGIDLITLFEALKYPIYVKEIDETLWCSNRLYFGLGQAFIVITAGKDIILSLKDYHKTWALTKEELEKESKDE